MKHLVFIFLSTFGSLAFSSPVDYSQTRLLSIINTILPNGDYEYRYSQDDGTEVKQTGVLTDINGAKVYRVTGMYSYTAPNGKQFTVVYMADENGYVVRTEPVAIRKTISVKAIKTILG